ncbi:MAG: archaeosortase A [Candidatus Methanoperedens sp.]|jgi:archaeosortase A (PGF-CTERM-specific)|nr:archaeosortase A [Candidatus Methanoperedens sp.]PKL53639.1 MAG: archaeosortase A [Candidatus Methanoperedenaceae archaeon HGW-Methanoperedenaceae-1]
MVILWLALLLLAVASAIPKTYNSRFSFAGFGWIFLSLYWFMQPGQYIGIQDYLNAFLVVVAALVSLFIAFMTFGFRDKGAIKTLVSLSRAVSVGGLVYFLFAEVELLNTGIISLVTDQTIWMVGKFGFPVSQVAWNQLSVNGLVVEVILACTSIESIALFTGLISSAAGAPLSRKFKAFMISVPVVYLLNIQRISFTASAYGLSWFGTPEASFHISEHIITKIGSMLALLLISYMVMKLLPEIADMIDGLWKMMSKQVQKVF